MFMQVRARISTSVIVKDEYSSSMIWMCHILFIHSLVEGNWGCFQFWAIVNNAVTIIVVLAFV